MIKFVLSILLLMASVGSVESLSSENYAKVDTSKLNFIRNSFYKAINDEDETYKLENYIIKNFSDDYHNYSPVILAYYGSIEALKAKHAFNPVSKVSCLISSLNRLSDAVKESPDNLEIRFLRFSVLTHLPGILGYNDEREADRNKVCKLLEEKDYSNISAKLQKGIIEFMLKSDRLSSEQTSVLENLHKSMN